ncbi:hypothetical protein BU17DRAFT_62243 [Hysterangium stoloniferum]|nr:hypothetical protein BU17DRAFT_62243 [Hysterangium stoloniferum]
MCGKTGRITAGFKEREREHLVESYGRNGNATKLVMTYMYEGDSKAKLKLKVRRSSKLWYRASRSWMWSVKAYARMSLPNNSEVTLATSPGAHSAAVQRVQGGIAGIAGACSRAGKRWHSDAVRNRHYPASATPFFYRQCFYKVRKIGNSRRSHAGEPGSRVCGSSITPKRNGGSAADGGTKGRRDVWETVHAAAGSLGAVVILDRESV